MYSGSLAKMLFLFVVTRVTDSCCFSLLFFLLVGSRYMRLKMFLLATGVVILQICANNIKFMG